MNHQKNKTMNKKILYILCVVMPLLCASCENWLTTDSPSKFTGTYVFGSETEMFKAVVAAYVPLTADHGYSIRMNMYYGVNTDVEYSGVNADPDAGRRDVFTGEATSTNSEVTNPWNNTYSGIGYSNEVIAGIESSPLFDPNGSDITEVSQMYGEVKTLRAFYYLDLVRYWGDVPFMITPTSPEEALAPTSATGRDEILDYLIKDVISVEPRMKYAAEMTQGVERISREFAQALIARMALFRGGYSIRPDLNNPADFGYMWRPDDYMSYIQISRTYSKKVIDEGQHDLASDYKEVFLKECRFEVPQHDDVIWEVAHKSGSGGSSEVGGYLGVSITAGNHDYGSASAAVNVTPTYFYSFDREDVRRFVNCSPVSYNSELNQVIRGISNISVGKWCKLDFNPPSGQSSTTKALGVNFPIMRFADVLLMFAEADNVVNSGPTAEAKEALKRVRRRAFPASAHSVKVDAYVDALTTQDAFFNAIVDERAWELGGEMLRKMDLARWNLMGDKIRQMRQDMIDMGKDAQYNRDGGTTPSGRFPNLPYQIYYKLDPATKKLDILGLDENYVGTVPDGYTTQGWLYNLYPKNSNTGEYAPASFITQSWRGCGDNPGDVARYVVPIPKTAIDASGGALKNYYGK
jgi:hypothetical protein